MKRTHSDFSSGMRSDSPIDFLPLDAALISIVRQSLRVDGHHVIFQRDYLYDFFRAMLDIYKDLFPVHLNMLLKNKQTFSASMPRDIHPSLFEVVESAIDSGNLQLIRDLPFYSVPPPLKAQWLPGVPDLNIVWERASKGVWHQPLRDAIGSQFSVLHPSLGLQSVHKTPIVVLEEYNDMWEAVQYMYQQRRTQHSRLFFVGHSGIGKSTFLQYATARACSEHHHFILASTNPSDHIFYFGGKNYPRVLSGDDFTRTAHATRAFILLDTQPAHPVPPSIFHNLDLLIVVSTSPQLECWEWARKDHTRRFFHVKLPSAKDLNNITEVSVNASSKPKLSLFPYIGPCIRELIQVVSQESASQECSENALTVAINCIIGAPFAAKGQRDAFYSLFFISPPLSLQVFHHRGEPLRLQTSFRPRYTITTALHYQILRDVFRPLEFRTDNSTLLSSSLNNHPAYGIVFEKEVLDRIQRGDITDTFELEPGKPRRLPSKLQEFLPGYALEIDAPPPHHHRDKWDTSQSYFVHFANAFPLIDAAIITPRQVILLQLMIANRRPVQLEGIRAIHKFIKVMEDTTGNFGRQWIFLFVVANGTSLVEIASGSSREAVVMAEAELGFKLNVTSLCIRERLQVEPDNLKFALLETDEYNGVARDELNLSAATNQNGASVMTPANRKKMNLTPEIDSHHSV